MSYTPNTDYVALWRNQSGGAAKAEMPSLDFIVAALGRAGLITVVTNSMPPTSGQPTTMWFQPANPTYAAEGILYLWDATAGTYKQATPTLFAKYLVALGA